MRSGRAGELLTVLIRPAENAATTHKADGETEPMRCLTAQVNGRGQVSRWYFRKTGELEYVGLSGGVRRVPSDAFAVKFDFRERQADVTVEYPRR